MDELKRLRAGDKSVIARTISKIENGGGDRLLERIFPYTGTAYQIGITGPPGAGKSTLVNAVAKKLLVSKRKIGIIAVDPTSPFSGGALLGDRIRMTDLALHENVFIRSMASRGSLGGLARKTKDAALVLDAAGMDFILIETIGVGQVELDIAQVCDTTVVVLVPESGDSIQAMKAGLLEIADVMVVNKGDREGCDNLLMALKFAFDLKPRGLGWDCPILKTIATEDSGIDELVRSILAHREFLETSGNLCTGRKQRLTQQVHELIEQKVRLHIRKRIIGDDELGQMIDKIYERKVNPYNLAEKIAKGVLKPKK